MASIAALEAFDLNGRPSSAEDSNRQRNEIARLKQIQCDLEAKLAEKDALLEEKERELQKAQSELEHAITSKMQSLLQSQNEIAKLKEMFRRNFVSGRGKKAKSLSLPLKHTPPLGHANSFTVGFTGSTPKKRSRSRHLQHLNGPIDE